MTDFDSIVEIIKQMLVVISAISAVVGMIYQFAKNRHWKISKFSINEAIQKIELFNRILGIAANYDTLSKDELIELGKQLIKDGLDGVGKLTSRENKQLHKFIEQLIGTRDSFDVKVYKMDIVNTLNELQNRFNNINI